MQCCNTAIHDTINRVFQDEPLRRGEEMSMFARSRGARIEMADVRPLRGLRYAPEAVKNLADVVTPPFDVISPEAQERYYARHPYNVIRLELGKITPEDNELNNRYTRAARTLA